MRILGDIERGVGFAAVNSLAKGAVQGAFFCMEEPEVLRAALGNPAPLAALQGREDAPRARVLEGTHELHRRDNT